MPRLKRASYKDAVDFIAFNDEPSDMNPDSVECYTTVQLVAAIFGAEPSRVAKDVVRYRRDEEMYGSEH